MSTSTAPMTGVFRAPLTGAYNGFSHDTAGANVSRYPQPVHCWTKKPRYAPATQKHAECVGQEQNLGDSSGTRAPPSIPEVLTTDITCKCTRKEVTLIVERSFCLANG